MKLRNLLAPMLTILIVTSSRADASAPSPDVIRLLRTQTQALLDAVGTGDAAVWRRFADDDLIQVDETGTVHTKAQLLAELRPLPPGLVGTLKVATFTAQQFGDVVVATHEDQERLDYHGQLLESRFRTSDTWRQVRRQGWRLIASHVIALQQDPPSVALPRDRLCAYEGTYALTAAIVSTVQCVDDGLSVGRTGRSPVLYKAELQDVFFAPGEPRTRRIFQRSETGAIVGFVDRREGRDIRWRRTGDH